RIGRPRDQHDAVIAACARSRLHRDAHVRADMPRHAAGGSGFERRHDVLDAADDRVWLDRPRVRAVRDEPLLAVTIVALIDGLEKLIDESLTGALDDERFEV